MFLILYTLILAELNVKRRFNCWNKTQNMKTYTVALTLNIFPTPACLVKMRHETKGYWNIIKPSAR